MAFGRVVRVLVQARLKVACCFGAKRISGPSTRRRRGKGGDGSTYPHTFGLAFVRFRGLSRVPAIVRASEAERGVSSRVNHGRTKEMRFGQHSCTNQGEIMIGRRRGVPRNSIPKAFGTVPRCQPCSVFGGDSTWLGCYGAVY